MIIIPRILTNQLKDVGGLHGRLLALSYGERAIRECHKVLSPTQLSSSLSYIAAARNLVEKSGSIPELADAHTAYFAARSNGDDLAESVGWIAAIAVAASCQREMEEAGILAKKSYAPDLVAVAKGAQDAVGRRVARISAQEGNEEYDLKRKIQWN